MAFFCPSQLALKKRVLQNKKPYPPDVYRPSTSLEQHETVRLEITKSALKNGSVINHKQVKRSVRINEFGFKHETLIEHKIRAATLAKPANIRVKLLQSYEPVNKEELKVRKGHYVKILYQQNDWVYVVDSSGREGFIPYCYCSTTNISTDSKSSTSGYEDSFEDSEDGAGERPIFSEPQFTNNKHTSNSVMTYFPKRAYGPQLTVLYDYSAHYENDISVCRGELVMLLNDQDEDWIWVATEDGEEGFVPRSFVVSHVCEACLQRLVSLSNAAMLLTQDLNSSDVTPTSSSSTGTKSKSSCTDVTSSAASSEKNYSLKGTKLIVLYNFEGRAFDDLPVHPGEYVFANLKDQIVPGMIWAYSPHRKKSGFIPEDHVKEPIVTDI